MLLHLSLVHGAYATTAITSKKNKETTLIYKKKHKGIIFGDSNLLWEKTKIISATYVVTLNYGIFKIGICIRPCAKPK